MSDPFQHQARSLEAPATRHFGVTPSDGTDLPVRPRVLYCVSAGTAVLRDAEGADLPYELEAGDILPVSAVRVLATGTTALLYGWL